MSNMYQQSMVTAMIMIVNGIQAGISNDTWWDDQNWRNDSLELLVSKGIVSGTTDATDQFITSPRSIEGHPDDYASKPNATRASSVLPESTFNDWLPNANSIYTYQSFLKAVAKFPAFCDESNGPLGLGDDDTCRREIAALFAHMIITSDGLSKLED